MSQGKPSGGVTARVASEIALRVFLRLFSCKGAWSIIIVRPRVVLHIPSSPWRLSMSNRSGVPRRRDQWRLPGPAKPQDGLVYGHLNRARGCGVALQDPGVQGRHRASCRMHYPCSSRVWPQSGRNYPLTFKLCGMDSLDSVGVLRAVHVLTCHRAFRLTRMGGSPSTARTLEHWKSWCNTT